MGKNPHPKTPVANKNPIVKPPHVVKSGGIHKNPDMFHVSDEDISSSGWSASDSDDAKKAAKKTLFDRSKAKRVNKVAKQAENGSDSDTPWVRAKEAVKAKALAESKLKVEDEIRTDKLKSLGKPSNDEFRKFMGMLITSTKRSLSRRMQQPQPRLKLRQTRKSRLKPRLKSRLKPRLKLRQKPRLKLRLKPRRRLRLKLSQKPVRKPKQRQRLR